MFVDHFEEASVVMNPLDLDREKYNLLEESGSLAVFTMRNSGKLVGYCVMIVHDDIKSRGKYIAQQDHLYVHPAYRGVSVVEFLRFVDSSLKTANVDIVYHVVGNKKFGRVLEHIGYHRAFDVYGKRL